MGMLHGAVKFKSKDPVINIIFMEMALLFAPQGATVEALHMWSEENCIADDLSRLGEGAAIPTMLTKVRRTACSMAEWRILGTIPTPPQPNKMVRRDGDR